MIKESVKSASTIEDAKAAALLELGLTEDDVYNIEVLQMPQKKTFGIFGGKPAEVKVWVDVPEKKENPFPKRIRIKNPLRLPKRSKTEKRKPKRKTPVRSKKKKRPKRRKRLL